MDCSLPGASVHGILQARILEWVTISFSKFLCVYMVPFANKPTLDYPFQMGHLLIVGTPKLFLIEEMTCVKTSGDRVVGGRCSC